MYFFLSFYLFYSYFFLLLLVLLLSHRFYPSLFPSLDDFLWRSCRTKGYRRSSQRRKISFNFPLAACRPSLSRLRRGGYGGGGLPISNRAAATHATRTANMRHQPPPKDANRSGC